MSGYEIAIICPRCSGTGQDPDLFDGDYHDCWDCENNRRIWVPLEDATVDQVRAELAAKTAERDEMVSDLTEVVGDLQTLRRELLRRSEAQR